MVGFAEPQVGELEEEESVAEKMAEDSVKEVEKVVDEELKEGETPEKQHLEDDDEAKTPTLDEEYDDLALDIENLEIDDVDIDTNLDINLDAEFEDFAGD